MAVLPFLRKAARRGTSDPVHPDQSSDPLVSAETRLALAAQANHPKAAIEVSEAVAANLGAFEEHAIDLDTALASRFDDRIVDQFD